MIVSASKNKRIALIALTSIFVVSFCLLPCRGHGVKNAAAGIHHSSFSSAADSGAHYYHGVESAGMLLKVDKGPCPHCAVSATVAFKDYRPLTFAAFTLPAAGAFGYIPAFTLTIDPSKLDRPPPKYSNPLYIINSSYII